MRPGTGCQSCRARHLKCLVPDGASICTRCSEAGRQCEFLPRYRFRRVEHVDTASQGLRSRTELRYRDDQPWVETRGEVSFVMEDGNGVEIGMDEAGRIEDGKAEIGGDRMDARRDDDAATMDGIEQSLDEDRLEGSGTAGNDGPALNTFDVPPETNQPHSSPTQRNYMTPASVPELTRRYVFGVTGSIETPYTPLGTGAASNAASPATSLPTPGSMPTRLKLSRREAFLMHHYINKIAPWVSNTLNSCGAEQLTRPRSTAAIC